MSARQWNRTDKTFFPGKLVARVPLVGVDLVGLIRKNKTRAIKAVVCGFRGGGVFAFVALERARLITFRISALSLLHQPPPPKAPRLLLVLAGSINSSHPGRNGLLVSRINGVENGGCGLEVVRPRAAFLPSLALFLSATTCRNKVRQAYSSWIQRHIFLLSDFAAQRRGWHRPMCVRSFVLGSYSEPSQSSSAARTMPSCLLPDKNLHSAGTKRAEPLLSCFPCTHPRPDAHTQKTHTTLHSPLTAVVSVVNAT